MRKILYVVVGFLAMFSWMFLFMNVVKFLIQK